MEVEAAGLGWRTRLDGGQRRNAARRAEDWKRAWDGDKPRVEDLAQGDAQGGGRERSEANIRFRGPMFASLECRYGVASLVE